MINETVIFLENEESEDVIKGTILDRWIGLFGQLHYLIEDSDGQLHRVSVRQLKKIVRPGDINNIEVTADPPENENQEK